jgi:hypothetical protein
VLGELVDHEARDLDCDKPVCASAATTARCSSVGSYSSPRRVSLAIVKKPRL